MSPARPSITVIVPARPEQEEVKAIDAARNFDYPKSKLEILLARGPQPSIQRNRAVAQAKGDWIWFLDDDSVATPELIQKALPHMQDDSVVMIGGPNLCPVDAPLLQRAFATVMGNKLAFGPSAARYRPMGDARESSEKELILCNLLCRKDAFLEAGGFDEALYPNEENALMDTLNDNGGKLIYDPAFAIHRHPRSGFKDFCKMLGNYGRGRAEQFRLHPGMGSVLNFVPPLFVLYLALLPPARLISCSCLAMLLLAPLLPYSLLVGWFGWTDGDFPEDADTRARRNPDWTIELFQFISVPSLIAITHIFYGIGFWKGLFTKLKTPQKHEIPVTIETIHV